MTPLLVLSRVSLVMGVKVGWLNLQGGGLDFGVVEEDVVALDRHVDGCVPECL